MEKCLEITKETSIHPSIHPSIDTPENQHGNQKTSLANFGNFVILEHQPENIETVAFGSCGSHDLRTSQALMEDVHSGCTLRSWVLSWASHKSIAQLQVLRGHSHVGGDWWIQEFHCIYAGVFEITYTTVPRTVFDQNQKDKSPLGFSWRMVLCVGKYWASSLNIAIFVALTCAW